MGVSSCNGDVVFAGTAQSGSQIRDSLKLDRQIQREQRGEPVGFVGFLWDIRARLCDMWDNCGICWKLEV